MQACYRLILAVWLVVRHEIKLVIICLGNLQRAVSDVWGVKHHQWFAGIVSLNSLQHFTTPDEFDVVCPINVARSVVSAPEINDRLIRLTAGLHIRLGPEIVLVRKVVQRSVITTPVRRVVGCRHPCVVVSDRSEAPHPKIHT